MAARVGIFLRDGRLTVVALGRRGRLVHVVVDGAEDLAATLAAELRARGLGAGRLRLGLDRRLAIVKGIELPRTEGGDLARMIGFDLERHVPFPREQTRFDWVALPDPAEQPRRVLMVAAEARTVERALALVTGAKRQPAALTVACHALPTLLPRALPSRHAVWAHRHDGGVDLLFVAARTLLMSRQVAAGEPAELARVIRRSLPVVRWSTVDDVWISGLSPHDGAAWRDDLTAALGVVAVPPPFSTAIGRRPSPACSGVMVSCSSRPSVTRTAFVSPWSATSSSPEPWTMRARDTPSAATVAATVSSRSGLATPSNWTGGSAGFTQGPSRFMIVRTLSARRTGPAWRRPGW